MQPIPARQLSAAVNWSIPGQLIDQFPAAMVVINSLPFRGRIDRLPPSQPHRPQPLPKLTGSAHPAVLSYAFATPAESTTRQKRHGVKTAKLRVPSVGGGDVFH
jgi:hypothetical protein